MNKQNNLQLGIQANLPERMTIFISGVASGIGAAQAAAFLQAGHQVFGVDMRWSEEIESLQNEYLNRYHFFQADLSRIEGVRSAVTAFKNTYSDLQVLCNTAGKLDEYQSIINTSPENWHHILSTNLYSMFYVTKELLPLLLRNSSSRLINMASIASLTAGGGGIAYTSSKHAIAGFTKQMAYDYSKQGLRANAIAPGAIATPMNQADFDGDQATAIWVAQETPLQRWALADEVAKLTLFLASDDADFMQGNIIPLDGGWLIR